MSPSSRQHPPRILLVILSLSAGGAERVVSEMANWWSAHGHEVAILTLWGREHDHYALNQDIRRLSLDFWRRSRTPWQFFMNRLRLPFAIRGTVSRFKPDVVISFIDLINIIMVASLAGTKIPLIISERIDPRHHAVSPLRSLARRLFYRHSPALVVQTESVAGWARTIMPPSRTEVIPNFVRMLPETPGPDDREAPEGPFILAMGRLDGQKGHDLLLRAFAQARTSHPEWKLVILGHGPWRPYLEDLASSLGISDAVLMPGVVREPAGWLRKAGFFVHPSRYEGFPNALLEAMACGCAVIAADCPSGPAEIIRHNENGLLVPREDVSTLAAAILRLMTDTGLRKALGARALQVKDTFSQGSIMTRWDSLIEKVRREDT